MNKYILDEDGNELEGVIGCNEDGYIFEDGYIETTKISCNNCSKIYEEDIDNTIIECEVCKTDSYLAEENSEYWKHYDERNQMNNDYPYNQSENE